MCEEREAVLSKGEVKRFSKQLERRSLDGRYATLEGFLKLSLLLMVWSSLCSAGAEEFTNAIHAFLEHRAEFEHRPGAIVIGIVDDDGPGPLLKFRPMFQKRADGIRELLSSGGA